MYKIGVIGDRESILGFKAVGLTVFPCDEAEEAKKILKQIAKEDFAIIYVTEELYQYMDEEIKVYVDLRLADSEQGRKFRYRYAECAQRGRTRRRRRHPFWR
mgnify:CR=1 FL=1